MEAQQLWIIILKCLAFFLILDFISTYPAVISYIFLSRTMQVCYSQLQSKLRSLVTSLISHSCLVKFNTLFQVTSCWFVSAAGLLFLLAMSWQNSMFPSMCPTNQSPQINPVCMECYAAITFTIPPWAINQCLLITSHGKLAYSWKSLAIVKE